MCVSPSIHILWRDQEGSIVRIGCLSISRTRLDRSMWLLCTVNRLRDPEIGFYLWQKKGDGSSHPEFVDCVGRQAVVCLFRPWTFLALLFSSDVLQLNVLLGSAFTAWWSKRHGGSALILAELDRLAPGTWQPRVGPHILQVPYSRTLSTLHLQSMPYNVSVVSASLIATFFWLL